MNKKLLITILILILVGGGMSLFYLSNDSSKRNMNDVNTPMDDISESNMSGEVTTTMDEDAMSSGDSYVVYSDGIIKNNSDKRTVLFFYANWCPTCIPADKEFKNSKDQFPEDVVVIRVNYNDPDTDKQEKALAKQYGVTYQHTFVQIDENGKEVSKWNGGSLAELLANIK